MISNCPNCKKQIEHEDFLFEVVCGCGARFNPFMLMENPNPLQGLADAPAPAAGGGGADPMAFKESENTLQEIRDFGEDPTAAHPGGTSTTNSLAAAAAAAANSSPAPRPSAPLAAPVADGTECPISAADTLAGYRIEATFLPVSAMAELDGGAADPMRNALSALWQNVAAGGGNGCVAFRWHLLPDGARVLVSGIPVRCSRG